MKKHEFIQELTTAIAAVDPQTKSEILADINEHFAEGASLGLSEEEICIKLGQPGQIAEQVLEEYNAAGGKHGYGQTSRDKQAYTNETIDSIGDMVGDIVGSLGELGTHYHVDIGREIKDAMKEGMKCLKEGMREGMKGFKEGMESLQEGLQEGIDEGFGPYIFKMYDTEGNEYGQRGNRRQGNGHEINIDESFTGISSLDISLSLCNIRIVPAPQGESTRVAIVGRSRYDNIDIENRHGCLVIAERKQKFKFDFYTQTPKLTATIYMPASFNGNIKAKTSVGNLLLEGLNGNLELKTSAGNIAVDNHNSSTAHLRSSAGGITLTGCTIWHIDAKSSAGAVSVQGNETGVMRLDSSAGAVNVRVPKLGGETMLSSSAGSIRLESKEVHGNITVKSSAGGVQIRLPMDVNCRIDAKKPSIGSVENHITGNPQSPHLLHVTTSVGSVVIMPME